MEEMEERENASVFGLLTFPRSGSFLCPSLRFSGRTKSEGLGGWEERSHISKKVETRIRRKKKSKNIL